MGRTVALLCTLALAPARFEAVQPELFSAGGALTNAWADYDADGDLDLFVGFGGSTPNRLYQNDGGTFRDVAADAAIADRRATRAAAWGDADGDGDVDLLIGFAPGAESTLKLYRNDGARFSDVTVAAGLQVDSGAVRQLSWIDYDADGDLDLFVGWRDRPNALYRNDRGAFVDIAPEIGLADPRKTVGAVWFDYDQDGDLDLYVANQDGDANGLYRNTRGRFRDVANAAGVAWGGRTPREPANGTVRPCAADVNNDGLLDLFLANYGKNGLFLNSLSGVFADVSEAWGIATDARYDTCAFADFDHDGLLDVYVNGTVTGGTSYRDYLYRNTGARFEDVTPDNIKALHSSHGAQWADFDLDGDQDLALAGTRADVPHALLRNQLATTDAARSLQLTVADARGRPLLAGAEVRIYSATSRDLVGLRLIDTGSGYNSQNSAPLHFGIPYRMRVDIEVAWLTPAGRRVAGLPAIDPERFRGRVLRLHLTTTGRLTASP